MSSHASTMQGNTSTSDRQVDGHVPEGSTGTERPSGEPSPGTTLEEPTGTGQPTWTQLHTPPQGAAYQRPMSPFAPRPSTSSGPLFPGALGAARAPMRMRQLAGLCAWAAALTLLGLGVGLWVMIRLMSYGTPGWYEPVIVLNGLVGVGLVIAAFVNLDKGNLPWYLMGGSTLTLFVSIGLTASV